MAFPGYRVDRRLVSLPVLAAVTLVPAAALVFPRRCWRRARIAVTAVHECGHAVAAVCAGRRVRAIHLRPDASGVTYHQGGRRRLPSVVVAAAGYPAPSAAGVAGGWLVAHGHPRAWLAALAVLGVAGLVLWVRNLFGALTVAAMGGALAWLVLGAGRGTVALVAAWSVWLLLLGGARAALELLGDRSRSDATDLARLTHLPAALVRAGFAAGSVAGAGAGALVLFGRG